MFHLFCQEKKRQKLSIMDPELMKPTGHMLFQDLQSPNALDI